MTPPILHTEVCSQALVSTTAHVKKHVIKPLVAPGEAKVSTVMSPSGNVALWVT